MALDVGSIFVGVAIVVGGLLLAFGLFIIFKRRSDIGGLMSNTLGGFTVALFNFIPMGMILFGFIADMFSQDFVFSIGSLVGLCSVIANYAVGGIISKIFPEPLVGGAEQWCTLPGLAWLESRTTPMVIVSTISIMAYYIASMISQGVTNIAMIGSFVGIFVIQLLTMYASGCMSFYRPIGGSTGINIVLSILLGTLFGGSSYAIVKAMAPQKIPFAQLGPNIQYKILNPFAANVTPASGAVSSTGPSSGGQCSAVQGDDNAYVCEAYKNGQLVTETISS